MNNYKVKCHIGEGAHGFVMKAIDLRNNKKVALKKLLIKSKDGVSMGIVREISALQHVDSDYIVQLLEVIPEGMGFVLVMEYMPLSLWELLRDSRYEITLANAKKYMKMLLLGLAHMHELNIMHRDLKPANLLINYDGALKIADFGLARLYTDSSTDRDSDSGSKRQYSHQVATRWYRAPELLYGSRDYTPAVDIWAAGCIFGEILNRSPLFPGETDIEQLVVVLQTLGYPSEETWPQMKNLPDYNKIIFPAYPGIPWEKIIPNADPKTIEFIQCFLKYDHNTRIKASQALKHLYFFTKPFESNLEEMPKPLPPEVWDFNAKIDFGPFNALNE